MGGLLEAGLFESALLLAYVGGNLAGGSRDKLESSWWRRGFLFVTALSIAALGLVIWSLCDENTSLAVTAGIIAIVLFIAAAISYNR